VLLVLLQVYFKELPAGQEVSLEYKFRIAPQVPTRDFSVAVHLVYEEMGTPSFYSSTVFNGTVEIVEKARLIDTEGIFMYLMIIGTTLLIGERHVLQRVVACVCSCMRTCKIISGHAGCIKQVPLINYQDIQLARWATAVAVCAQHCAGLQDLLVGAFVWAVPEARLVWLLWLHAQLADYGCTCLCCACD
jgi:hypothetical protein